MRKFLPPVLFGFLFILESLFVQFLPGNLFGGQVILVPHFLIIAILFFAIYGNKKQAFIYGFIFGLLFDIDFTEILGIYLFFFPFITYIVLKIMKILQVNILTVSFFSLVGVALLEIGVYELNKLIGITTMNFSTFFNIRFIPTLLLNLIFTVIAAYPLKWKFENYADYIRAD